jgi:hypothetical protein
VHVAIKKYLCRIPIEFLPVLFQTTDGGPRVDEEKQRAYKGAGSGLPDRWEDEMITGVSATTMGSAPAHGEAMARHHNADSASTSLYMTATAENGADRPAALT